jgi:hypothetical protein
MSQTTSGRTGEDGNLHSKGGLRGVWRGMEATLRADLVTRDPGRIGGD